MAEVKSSIMDDADVRTRDHRLSPVRGHHLTSSPSQDSLEEHDRTPPINLSIKMEQPELIMDMEVAAVEVVTASAPPRRGRGRPRLNKDVTPKKSVVDADVTPRIKRPYKKRASKATADPVPKAKRKYVRRQKSTTNDKGTDKIKDKEKEKERKEREKERKDREKKEKARKVNEKKERRKKEAAEKKPRQKKPRRTPAKKAKQLIQPLTPAMINARQKKLDEDVLSDGSEDSVVFCQEFRPPDHNRHTSTRLPFLPHHDNVYPETVRAENNLSIGNSKSKPKPSGRDSPIVSRLEDSSSGNSNSSSNSDSSDSDSSDSTDDDDNERVLSDMERRKAETTDRLANVALYNGASNRLSVSPERSQSSSDTDSASSSARMEGRQKNGAFRSTTPPRSPSSASSENADKSFQCHTCRKWFSSTVTLRIHKRSHVVRSGNGSSGALSSGGGGQRSSRRYECDCCDATFTRRERLEQHRCEMHSGALTERCEVCGRGFEDEEQQRRHTALHTPDERAGRCGECGEVVNGWEELRRHRAAHAPAAAHACPLCRKAFTYPHSLSRHLSNHSKAVYKCVVCKTSFSDADSLAKHLNSHLDRYKQLKT